MATLLEIQNRRIKAIVEHAYATVPHYRQVMDEAGLRPHDIRTANDLAVLPFLTGSDLARDPLRFRSRSYSDLNTVTLQSSGTSGHSKRIAYDHAALFIALAHGHRQRIVLGRILGKTFGYREMDVVRSAGSSAILRNFYDAYSWTPKRIDLRRRMLYAEESLEEGITQVNAFKPDVIRGYATYIGAIFRRAHERNLPLSAPRIIAYGSDRLGDFDRELIESKFGVHVISTYQAVEALRIAFQCELAQGFHVSLDDVAVRVVDARGNPVGPGETGEIVISNLVNRATVLLNYKLGDMATVASSACTCGRTLPGLLRIDGRSDDLVVLADGRVVHSLVALQGLRAVPGIVQLQLVQEETRRFSLRAVCSDQLDWQQASRDFTGVLRRLFGDDITLDLERVEAIAPEPGGKVRAVISRCLPAR